MTDERVGSTGSFEDYVVTRGDALAALARVLCGHREVAEDVLQEVLLRVCAQWERIAPLAHREAYVRRMLVNEHLSWRRRDTRQLLRDSAPEPPPPHPDPADHVGEHAHIIALLAPLPPRQRAAMVLRFYGDLSDREIGEAMGCTPSTARSYLSRAIAALRLVPSERSTPHLTEERS